MQLLEHRRVDDLASSSIGKAFAYFFELLVAGVVRESLLHAVTASGDHGGVQRVMSVVVGAHLNQSPARAQKSSELAADYDAAFGFAAFGQLQVALDVVFEKAADVAGVVEVAVLELFGFLCAEFLA